MRHDEEPLRGAAYCIEYVQPYVQQYGRQYRPWYITVILLFVLLAVCLAILLYVLHGNHNSDRKPKGWLRKDDDLYELGGRLGRRRISRSRC